MIVNQTVAAVSEIRTAANRFVGECARASDSQWSFRPSPDAWSMAHVSEHVTISMQNIHRLLTQRLLASPITAGTAEVIDVEIPYLFYRGEEPPNIASPTGDWSREFAIEGIEAGARGICDWAGSVEIDFRSVGVAHPAFGVFDGIQWLLFVAAHTERHRAQLIGLRRHPKFPAATSLRE